ncbi:acetolactate synthase [Mycobacterium hubeiense]|uniref:acetolactate synthase n=1 Tax=Mycobacterium hubeiense TaxID=1867256 RepID=UPI000C7F3933|nr:acetolactate synthase [Mycobacterium sp. QGD 101]
MSIDAPTTVNAGHLIARRLKASGIDTVFTLSGGHLFSIYDGCHAEGIRLIDTRHEQTAAFAAEGWSKVTRVPGVAALTAGPGVTNGMSAMAAAQQNQSPLVVLGGRAPALRWGQGSLQEIDHVPFVAPLARFAATASSADAVGSLIDDALRAAVGAPSGVAFVDFPMDHVFSEAHDDARPGALTEPTAAADQPDGNALEVATRLLAEAQRPVIMAGTNVWWGHGEASLLNLAERMRIPVLMNGMARGVVPADHELAFSRARSKALGEADVALVIGVPMDFRLGFGGVFGADTRLIAIDRVAPERDHPRAVAAGVYGDLTTILSALAASAAPDHESWIGELRAVESAARAAEQAELSDDRTPLHPMRLYAELTPLLDRDAIIVIDAGDFGSYAGRVIDSYVPGAWLDSGPFGCLGSGPGYALAAKLARPDRQVVLLQGDGAFGFSGMEWDTLVRHGVQVVSVIGNNGIWALEKHPMEMLYGYSVVADLRPGTRYDEVVKALGGHGELVSTPAELRPALERAFSSGLPAVVNTLTDPTVVYPRRSNLA